MAHTRISAAEELALAHVALMDDLGKLENVVRPESPHSVTEVRAELRKAQAHITQHFRSEEQDGYMAAVRKREPRLEHAIQELREGHRKLASGIEALIYHASTASTIGEPLREEIRKWIASIRHHEARENQLVQETFGLDISAED